MGDAAGAPEMDRRELLVDLGSRLDALLRHLVERGVVERGIAAGELAGLRTLVTRLDEAAVLALPRERFANLWTQTLAALNDFVSA
jgi:hypothetical protein